MSKKSYSQRTNAVLWGEIKKYDGLPSREVAMILGIGKSTINDYRAAARDGRFNETTTKPAPKILTLDIESKPHLSYHWSMWDQNIYSDQVKEYGGMLCFAAKWLGQDEIIFSSEWDTDSETMSSDAYELLDQCDVLVTYNGDKYDIRRLNNEFLKYGWGPTSPYKSIDLIKANRQRFDLPSRKLDFIAGYVADDHKIENTGWKLWRAVIEDGGFDGVSQEEARELMRLYNEQDVVVTEKVYNKILPWIPNPVQYGMFSGEVDVCAWCGGELKYTGKLARTNIQEYPAFQCVNCGGWHRSTEKMGNALKYRTVR